ncbi:TIGR02301 family protein [Neorhizobium lilium]|uniref:TIGR02301 family protein n=1 Tax=Neorhizobium lilium TaxID=2503024 RepID=A0A444LDZ4_9HYPH|nr:TIGR02301 family protein [Neorhizobium lilium]RWX75924.1 TIGR02301 family protein [Neorhizobium lilium]
MIVLRLLFLVLIAALATAMPMAEGWAQSKKQQQAAPPPPPPPVEDKPAPYDTQLNRLAEVLGSISYLRMLCGAQREDWRDAMRQFLDADTANEPKRREKLTAAYNRGYRSFAAVHTACTPAAQTAAERYRNEGATLATEITSRFGN